MSMFPAEVEQDRALPSCLSSHTVNKCPFCGIFSANFFFFAFLCFLSVISPFKIVLKCYLVFLSTGKL